MTTQKAFVIAFTPAVLMEVLHWFGPWSSLIDESLFWGGYLLLIVLGFLVSSSGNSYRATIKLTWPFVLLWLCVGILNFALDRGEIPPDWTPEKNMLAFYGYLFASLLFLPVAFASSALGVWLERKFNATRRQTA